MVSEAEIKELVILRLETMPEHFKLSMGGSGEFDKHELIERVKKGDEIGKKIVKIQLNYLRSLKKGLTG